MKNVLFVLGTRPEAIKLAPVILALRETQNLAPFVCNTEQQKELSNQTLDYFDVHADFNLDVMTPNQSLGELNARLLVALQTTLARHSFAAVVVQGDTMSVFAGACAAFYNHIPVFHVEAGLRSFDLSEPFPEEALRQMTTRLVALHFAPTENARNHLLAEGIPENKIVFTGNTIVDALSRISSTASCRARAALQERGVFLDKHPVLVTAHRRENHGERLDRIVAALNCLMAAHPEKQFVVPVHPNPNVKKTMTTRLAANSNVILTEPLNYPELVELQRTAHLILTDSGGIQEEAPTFGVPVLVLRYETERPEGVACGFAKLVGADFDKIVVEAQAVLSQPFASSRLQKSANPYGDGLASCRIAEAIQRYFTHA